MVRIVEVQSGSVAEELEIEIGTRIVRINGERVRDGIDFTFLVADPELTLEAVAPDGTPLRLEVERDPGEVMGLVPAPDKVRECANECVFCFIEGNPKGVRDSLWLRDDDFRLSFTYGSYVTLTNLGPRGLQRLVDQKLSPVYVSVHATDPEVRQRLLKNDRAGLIMDQLRTLLEGGLEVHAQVVLCPGWNDGVHLDRTIEDLWSLGPGIRSLSVVPVGLTRYNLNRPVRLLTKGEALDALAQVNQARSRAHQSRDFGWCYAADELFLTANRPPPGLDYYDDEALVENGVGALRRFLDDFDSGLSDLAPIPVSGVRIVTGTSMAPFLRERAGRLSTALEAPVEVVPVKNRLFGDTVTVAGLLPGQDIVDALGEGQEGELVLLPGEALNGDALFIDSMPLAEVTSRLAPARVEIGYEVTATLRTA